MNLVQSNDYKGYRWRYTDWVIGDRITEERVDNIEAGILINANLINDLSNRVLTLETGAANGDIDTSTALVGAIVSEIGGTYENFQFTDSRIDRLETNYNTISTKTSSMEQTINSMINTSIPTINQNITSLQERVSALEAGSGGSSSEEIAPESVQTLINEVYGSSSTSSSSRIDKLENKVIELVQSVNSNISDTITISKEIKPNSVIFVALKSATAGSSTLKIRDEYSTTYTIYKNYTQETITQKIKAGTILGLYCSTSKIYAFNLPLTI